MALPVEKVTISRATQRDHAVLAELQRRSMRALAADYYSPAQIEAFLTVATPDLVKLLRAGTVWLAWSGQELVASAGWHFEGALATLGQAAPSSETVAVFRSVYVRPGWSRRGLASMMMAKAEADARSKGAINARLHAMLSAVEFYRARGYETTGPAVFDLAGTPFPGVGMKRALDELAAEAA